MIPFCWNLLWQENEYLWQPIITPMPPDGWIYQVHVTHNNGSPFTANAGPPTTNPPLLVYDSGGWGGIGYGGTSSAGPPSNLWPFGYGTPPMTGELDLGLSVEILPCIKATNTTLGEYLQLLNPNKDNGTHEIAMKKTAPSAQQKRVGVTAIASMAWQPIDGVTNKIRLAYSQAASGNGIGLQCFPEQDSPNASVNDQIDVKVTLAAPVPTGMTGTVHLAWFDPNNPKGSTKTPATNGKGTRDNHGSIKFVNSPTNLLTLTFNTTTNVQTQLARMQFVKIPGGPSGADAAHAGDNYIVAAHPNKNPQGTAGIVDTWRFKSDGVTLEYPVSTANGTEWKTLDDNHQTELLTVWRTLWVERDAMADPQATIADGFDPAKKGTGEGQWNTFVPTPEPKDFDLFLGPLRPGLAYLSMAMVAACIEVISVDQSPANSSWITNDSATVNPGAWDVYTTPFVHNVDDHSGFTGKWVSKKSRDVNINEPSFWCLHAVGAYEDKVGDDYDTTGSGGILGRAFPGTDAFLIYDETIRDMINTHPLAKRTIPEIHLLVAFHEVLHFFGFIDNVDGDIMNTDINDANCWFRTPTIPSSVSTLSATQIQKIQKRDYPHL